MFDLNDLEQFFSNKMFDEVDKTPSMDDTFYELVEQLELILKTQIRNKVDQVYFIESKFKDFFRLLNNQKEKNTIINFLNFLLKK